MDGSVKGPTSEELQCMVSDHLTKRETEDALSLVKSEANVEALRECAWDLVPQLCQFLTEEIEATNPEVIDACAEILDRLAEVAKIKELLLVLLEQADTFKDDVKFKALLPPVQKCIMGLPAKRGHSIGIALETLYAHVSTLPLPEDYKLEGKEKLIYDADPSIWRMNDVVSTFVAFLTPMALEVSWQMQGSWSVRQQSKMQVSELVGCLVKVLDHPLAYADLTFDNAAAHPAKSSSRICAEQVVHLVCHLKTNLLDCSQEMLHDHLMLTMKKQRWDKSRRKNEGDVPSEEMDDYSLSEPLPMLGLSTFAYLAFGEQLGERSLPLVYTHRHVLELNLPFVVYFLLQAESLVVYKGLLLFDRLQGLIPNASFSAQMMEWRKMTELIKALLHVMTSSKVKEVSQSAVKMLRRLLGKFEKLGRNKFLCFVMNSTKHSGVIGYVTTLLKDEVDQSLATAELPDGSFVGPALERLLVHVFSLPGGEQADLLECSEQIMGALNLLRYLVLRDKPSENVTGIWSLMPKIESSYNEVLRKGINMSRAHYELEIKKTKEDKHSADRRPPDMSFSVGGQQLGELSQQQQLEVLEMAVHTFDMMESILGRVGELIEQQRRIQKP